MSDPDYLAPLPEPRVAAWYRRLARLIGQQRIGGEAPLSALFLNHYLDNRDPDSVFPYDPPQYLRASPYVLSVLQYHRAVFLTAQRARTSGGGEVWAGVLPRIQGLRGFTRWDLAGTVDMEYESLVEVGSNQVDIVRIEGFGTPEEQDLLGAFHGFQLHHRVTVRADRLPNSHIRITFDFWGCRALDWYHFDYSKHLRLPNPDYGDQTGVRPQDRKLLVYHSNARRIERAGLAAPYHSASAEWQVRDAAIAGPGEVDPSRRL